MQRRPDPDIGIDESSLQEAPSIGKGIRNVLYSLVLGLVFVQVISFYRIFHGFAFMMGGSVVTYFYSYPLLFAIYMIVCAVMGWIYGQKFIDWLNYKISEWKF